MGIPSSGTDPEPGHESHDRRTTNATAATNTGTTATSCNDDDGRRKHPTRGKCRRDQGVRRLSRGRRIWEGRAATLNRAQGDTVDNTDTSRVHRGGGDGTYSWQLTFTHSALDTTGGGSEERKSKGSIVGQDVGGMVGLDGCGDGGKGIQGDDWTNVALPPHCRWRPTEKLRHDLGGHAPCVGWQVFGPARQRVVCRSARGTALHVLGTTGRFAHHGDEPPWYASTVDASRRVALRRTDAVSGRVPTAAGPRDRDRPFQAAGQAVPRPPPPRLPAAP